MDPSHGCDGLKQDGLQQQRRTTKLLVKLND